MSDAYTALRETIAEKYAAIDMKGPEKARSAENCPAPILGHLAWSVGLDYWGNWDEATKRAVILQAPANLRIRGTRAAVEGALAPFGEDIVIEEWWEQTPEGVPGTARLTVDLDSAIVQDGAAQDFIRRLLARESRKSIHWTVIVPVEGAVSAAPVGRARVATLYQYSGVQSGA